jgi:hypothetical protein
VVGNTFGLARIETEIFYYFSIRWAQVLLEAAVDESLGRDPTETGFLLQDLTGI